MLINFVLCQLNLPCACQQWIRMHCRHNRSTCLQARKTSSTCVAQGRRFRAMDWDVRESAIQATQMSACLLVHQEGSDVLDTRARRVWKAVKRDRWAIAAACPLKIVELHIGDSLCAVALRRTTCRIVSATPVRHHSFSLGETSPNRDTPEHVDASQAGTQLVIRRSDNESDRGLLDRMSNVGHSEIIVIYIVECPDTVRIGLDHHTSTAVCLVRKRILRC